MNVVRIEALLTIIAFRPLKGGNDSGIHTYKYDWSLYIDVNERKVKPYTRYSSVCEANE